MRGLGESIYYEGVRDGVRDGVDKGATLINNLNHYLLENNLMDELHKSVSDKEYQKKLIEKYNITDDEPPSESNGD